MNYLTKVRNIYEDAIIKNPVRKKVIISDKNQTV